MTARQIRAYLKAAVKIRAQECLEEASIASIHAMSPANAKSLLDTWYFITHPKPETKFIDGKLTRVHGDWKILDLNAARALLKSRGKKKD